MMYLMHPPERKGSTLADILEHAAAVGFILLTLVFLAGVLFVSGVWRERR
jgi:ABC-type uncharacterized transport system permease subunit